MTSIRRRLLVWLLAVFTATTVVAAIGVYRQARVEARELFDYQLQQMATAFPRRGFGSLALPAGPDLDIGDVLVVQVSDQGGTEIYVSRPDAPRHSGLGMGFSTVATRDGEWRVYSAAVGENIVRIMQPAGVREALAAGMALRTISPLLVLLPVLIGVIWLTVGRGLKPLNEVATAVSARSAEALDPLPERRLPEEVRPLVGALNDLLARLGRSLDRQRAFIADAAHELRTPLTALLLQIQIAERADTSSARAAALGQLRHGVERAARLVGQLLTLARNEPDAAEQPFSRVDMAAIAREVVGERAPIADAKDVELGVSGATTAAMNGNADGLRAMLGNLIDNAVQCTPARGSVDVDIAADSDSIGVIVSDTGPGIPPEDRERVFERFNRGSTPVRTGSGLGLAIVKIVARRHGATVTLDEAPGGGLRVAVRFPLARRAAGVLSLP